MGIGNIPWYTEKFSYRGMGIGNIPWYSEKFSYHGRRMPKPSMTYEKILIPWNPATKPSMVYGKNPISCNQRSKPSMIYGKNPISWNPATKPSMIYQIIHIPWNPNNPQKIIPWYKGKLSTPWNYYCPAKPPDYSSSRPQLSLKSASSRPLLFLRVLKLLVQIFNSRQPVSVPAFNGIGNTCFVLGYT